MLCYVYFTTIRQQQQQQQTNALQNKQTNKNPGGEKWKYAIVRFLHCAWIPAEVRAQYIEDVCYIPKVTTV